MRPDTSDAFYELANQINIHSHASKFKALPEIDEIEDGGSPWPANSLGVSWLTDSLPLVLIENDDDDGVDDYGDYLLAQPALANPYSTAGLPKSRR